MKILIVDDEQGIRSIIKEYCEEMGYETEEAESGKQALEKLKIKDFDLMVLDIMMPEMDGYTMLKECPKSRRIPTIVLSARAEEYDKLAGFDLGIDDYVTKPFSPKELIARIKAITNRINHTISDNYKYQTLEVNFLSHTIKINEQIIEVTPKEFEILTYLIHNKNIAISREQLLSNVWGYDYYGDDRTVDTHIKMLRNNLKEYRNNIQTVRGIGYKYVEDEQ
ncbi:MAG: response regulator transcription factor [Bacilli bacterium]|nr:response regulator transcription factor [Bacilli bacterium]